MQIFHFYFFFQLLEQSTEKLQLPFAARQVYLEGGTKVTSPHEIPYGASIYVSMGEPYKDPFKNTKSKSIYLK